MSEILLDREGTARIPPGFQVAETEVEFLRVAPEAEALVVRGARLCDWAATFFRGRRATVRTLVPLSHELRQSFPRLTDDQAGTLAGRLEDAADRLERPLSAQTILEYLFPTPLWSGTPSAEHAAVWLLWVRQWATEEDLQPVLAQLAENWQRQSDPSEAAVYTITTPERALKALDTWLGIGSRADFPILTTFPVEVPDTLVERARKVWRRDIVETQGQHFDVLVGQAIPFPLLQIAAREAGQYYRDKPHELSKERLDRLALYLSRDDHEQLRRLLAPGAPGRMPAEPEAVLQWFREQYLPYREWQRSNGSDDSRAMVLQAARAFAEWYLTEYPSALAGARLARWISFNKSAAVGQAEKTVTLIVILDGLHVPDARLVLQGIRQNISRLEVLSDGLAFAPLPTVTQFAKEALLRGVPPGHIDEVKPIGEILPEDESPAAKLATSVEHRIYLWRVLEPDRTYHKRNSYENLLQDIEGRLVAEVHKIQQIVAAVPSDVVLQIIVATDHGRMLGKAVRILPIPEGMQGHGRAAWGEAKLPFPAEGFIVRDDIAYLYGDRFGLKSDVAIPLDESSFMGNDGRAGTELFPHGGLFPEEVIVPWIVLARDHTAPQVEVTLTGTGRARRTGILRLTVMNMGDVPVELRSLTLDVGRSGKHEVLVGLKIGQRAKAEWEGDLSPWPSPSDCRAASAIAHCVPPNGVSFDVTVSASLQSEDLYIAPDNILEDLT
ncbi:MAG: hypothetical protein IT318_06310 [Anaerolineales bacterium]|nr:hypothetical protein [Anaerolineales bacterium]